jgi:hypothetical protein
MCAAHRSGDARRMTTSTVLPIPAAPAPARAHRLEPRTVLLVGTGIAAASLLAAVAGLAHDPRWIEGAPAWLKPAKFGISIALYLVTIQWMISFVRGHRRLLLAIAWVLVIGLTAEIVLIDLQVIRGTTSHFNEATVFDTAVYFTMGGFVSTVFLATVAAAVLVLRTRGLDAGIAAGMRWGLLLTMLGMAEAVLMTVNSGWNDGGGHTVGAPDGGPGLPLTDWSSLHGDLRIGHFLGLHALQALPILAWLLARFTGLDERTRVRLLRVAGLGYAGLVLLVTWQALRGQALLAPDVATLAAGAGLVAAVAGAGWLVLRRSL